MLKKTNTTFSFIFLLSCILFSCSTDDTLQSLETANSVTTSIRCTTVNNNPFDEDFKTYGNLGDNCESTSSFIKRNCFPAILKDTIESTFNSLAGFQFPGTVVDTKFDNSFEAIPFSDMDVITQDLSPLISPEDSNKIYSYLFCQINQHFNTLPRLAPKGCIYYPVITGLSTSFDASGPTAEGSLLTINYDIKIYKRFIR